ncbi:MAG: TMEM175 family protein [Herbiconiux sp.]|nr:TMEM175 family protein [Herbiconiux sp.]
MTPPGAGANGGPESDAAPESRAVAEADAEDARRGVDRLIFFSDAVIAIAITLIVLPLVDAAREPAAGADAPTTARFLAENAPGFVAAGISFLVIGSFWREHHRIFGHATGFTRRLVAVNLLWLAGIVALPLVTVLKVDAAGDDRLANALYIGAVGLTMALLRVEELVLVRSGLVRAGYRPSGAVLAARWIPVGLTAVALVLASVWPQLALYPLLLLVLAGSLQALVRRRETASGRPVRI